METRLGFLLVGVLAAAGCVDNPVGSGGTDDDDDGTTTGGATSGTLTIDPSSSSSTSDGTSTGDPTLDPDTGSSSSGSSSSTGDIASTSSSSTGDESTTTGVQGAPEIEVTLNASDVESGQVVTAPNTTDVGAMGDTVTVEVSNTGDADLDLTDVTIEGAAVAHFQLDDAALAPTVAPGESTTFTVTFMPINGGAKQAQIVIDNNDADESPFEVGIRARTTPNVWRNITPKGGPSARYNMALSVLEPGTLLTFGGRDAAGGSLGDTWTYDIEANAWTEVAPATSPTARFSYGMDNAGDGLVVLTGGTLVPGDGGAAQSDTWHFSADDMDWVMSMNNGTPPARHQAAVAGFDGGLFSYGGIDPTPSIAAGLFLYDAGTQTWVELDVPNPGPRLAAAAAFDGDGVVTLSGGFDSNQEPGPLASAYDVVLATSVTTEHTAPALGAVYSHELVYVRDELAIAFGGRDEFEIPSSATFSYEPGTGNWTDLAPTVAPSARFNFGMTAVGENKMILFGGLVGDGKGPNAPSFEVWEYVGPQP